MPQHWHSYTWTGHGLDLGKGAERRAVGGPTFQASMIPPEVTAEWLLRPRTAITRTYDDPKSAAHWLAEQYQDKPPEQPQFTVEENRAAAFDKLTRGTDAIIAHYLPPARPILLPRRRHLLPQPPTPRHPMPRTPNPVKLA